MSEVPRVPIPERGGRQFPVGTVYYSRLEGGFLRAGREDEGVLPLAAVSGRVSWSADARGIARFRDETGVFIKTGVFISSQGTSFRSGFLNVEDIPVPGIPAGQSPGPDGQWVERITLARPDGKIEVIEVNHGIGSRFNEKKQGKQWWRKTREALSEEGEKPDYEQVQSAILSREVILRVNRGPLE